MADRLTWSWKKAGRGLLLALALFLSMCLCGVIATLQSSWLNGITFIIVFIGGLSGPPILWLMFSLTSEQVEETTYPQQRLKNSVHSGRISTLMFGLLGGLISGLGFWLLIVLPTSDTGDPKGYAILGMLGALMGGVMGALRGGYLPLFQHYALRFVLYRHKYLPFYLVPFLDRAVELIFLRRVGGSYIFVHRLLMEHFAEMENGAKDLTPAPSPSGEGKR